MEVCDRTIGSGDISLFVKGTMSAGIRIPERIPARIEEAVVVDDPPRIGHHRIRRDEGAEVGVVVSGVVVEQTGGVTLLAGEGAVGLQTDRRAAFGTVGVVGAAGLYG